MSDNTDWKLKQAMGKVPVHYLNTPIDFPAWHVALRRLVVGYNMTSALMYTIPSDQQDMMKERTERSTTIVKQQEAAKAKPVKSEFEEDVKVAAPEVIDLSVEVPFKPVPKTEKEQIIMKSMNITNSVDAFFSATTTFTNIKTGTPDTDKESYFRQEIWIWMEQSLSKGQFKWVVKTIGVTFDIHALHVKIMSLTNKASWISHAIEYRKIFTMSPPKNGDIFQYQAELQDQIKLVKAQGETLGLDSTLTPWVEQGLLLVAAWENPAYRKMALEFTMDDKAISANALVKELQKQQMLTAHLNQSNRGGGDRFEKRPPDVRARVATTSGVCFGFQKGTCKRGADCRFRHEKEGPTPERKASPSPGRPTAKMSKEKGPKKSSLKKKGDAKPARRGSASPSPKGCSKCGPSAGHPTSECKFDGTCSHCGIKGHKLAVCRKKQSEDKAMAKVVFAEEEVSIRMLTVVEDEDDVVVSARVAIVQEEESPPSEFQEAVEHYETGVLLRHILDIVTVEGDLFMPLTADSLHDPGRDDLHGPPRTSNTSRRRRHNRIMHDSSDSDLPPIPSTVYQYEFEDDDEPVVRMLHVEEKGPEAVPLQVPTYRTENSKLRSVLRLMNRLNKRRINKRATQEAVLWGRNRCEEMIYDWWIGCVSIYGVKLDANDMSAISDEFETMLRRKVTFAVGQYGAVQDESNFRYLVKHSEMYGRQLYLAWVRAVSIYNHGILYPEARILVALDGDGNPVGTLGYPLGTLGNPMGTLGNPRGTFGNPLGTSGYPSGALGNPSGSSGIVVNTLKINAKEYIRCCVDSGANRDIFKDVSLAKGLAKPKVLVIGEAGKGHSFLSEAEGPIFISVGNKQLKLFERTIFASKIGDNIMSVSEAVDKGFTVVFTQQGVQIYKADGVAIKGEPVLTGERDPKTRLFHINLPLSTEKAQQAVVPMGNANGGVLARLSPLQLTPVVSRSCNQRVMNSLVEATRVPTLVEIQAFLSRTYHELPNDWAIWHGRFMHVNPRLCLKAKPDLKDWPKKAECDDCIRGKFHKHSHSGSRPAPKDLHFAAGEFLTCDLFGPLLTSAGGAKYVGFYVDLKSRFIYGKPLRDKTSNYQAFLEVMQDCRARSGKALRFFKTDGDGIFTGGEAQEIYAAHFIRHIQSAPGDSASNDVAERTIRTIVELTRTNLLHSGAPPNLWADCMAMVIHVWNNLATCPGPTTSLLSRTNLLEGHTRQYDLSILRAFGTKCFFMLTIEKKGGRKLAMGPKAQFGAIIGIEDNMAAYRVFDFNPRGKIRKIPFAQIVTHEGHFPFRDGKQWTEEEKDLPESFIPSVVARSDPGEWSRYDFNDDEKSELNMGLYQPPASVQAEDSNPPPLEEVPMAPLPPPPLDEIDEETGPHESSNESSSSTSVSGESQKPSDSMISQQSQQEEKKGYVLRPRGPRKIPGVVIPPLKRSKKQSGGFGSGQQNVAEQKDAISDAAVKPLDTLRAPSGTLGKPLGTLGNPLGTLGNPSVALGDPSVTLGNPSGTSGNVSKPQDVWRQALSRAALHVIVFDKDDLALESIITYRSNAGPLPAQLEFKGKIISTDPLTKPISIPAPKNRKEALQSPWWDGYYAAELLEMKSHKENGTWELRPRTDVPPGTPILRDRWAYDDKLSVGGKSNERFKARLTAMGCFQKAGIDYSDTYASVMSTRAFRMLLWLVNSHKDHRMDHWDVSTAFIHAPLKEKVWMKQATGHEVPGKESWVCLLLKALYGTKQAAHAWQQHLKKLLGEVGLKPLILDPATYLLRDGEAFIATGTHVDDLFVVYNVLGRKLRDKVWKHLSTYLAIKDLGEAKWTLQMSIQRDAVAGVLKISQENFIIEVLRRFQMTNCNTAPTPAVDTGVEATMEEADLPNSETQLEEIKDLPFLELIGCLWWLAQMTRVDIFVALQRASHWVAKPSMKLWRWLIRILKYLAGTKEYGIVYSRNEEAPPLSAYVDAAFADNTHCRSTAGWIFMVHGAMIAYDSVAIKRVVTSSTEAECAALTIIGKENSWQRQMHADLMGIKGTLAPTPILEDNTAAIALIAAGVTKRSRHFSIEWFKFRDLSDSGELEVKWVSTVDNLADFLTKKLPRERFCNLRDRIMGDERQQAYFKAKVNVCKTESMVVCSMLNIADSPPLRPVSDPYLSNFYFDTFPQYGWEQFEDSNPFIQASMATVGEEEEENFLLHIVHPPSPQIVNSEQLVEDLVSSCMQESDSSLPIQGREAVTPKKVHKVTFETLEAKRRRAVGVEAGDSSSEDETETKNDVQWGIPETNLLSALKILGIKAEERRNIPISKVQEVLHVATIAKAKFGEYSPLVSYLPPEMLNWQGPILVRMINAKVLASMLNGDKRVEIMKVRDWVAWGAQGYIVAAIYQGSTPNRKIEKRIPQKFWSNISNRAHDGKFVGLMAIYPPWVPISTGDHSPGLLQEMVDHRIWIEAFCIDNTRGVHPVRWIYKFPVPVAPLTRRYKLLGGFMSLSEADHHLVMEQCLNHKSVLTRIDGAQARTVLGSRPDGFQISQLLSSTERKVTRLVYSPEAVKSSWEPAFPARLELFKSLGNTPSPLRVKRSHTKLRSKVAEYGIQYGMKDWYTAPKLFKKILIEGNYETIMNKLAISKISPKIHSLASLLNSEGAKEMPGSWRWVRGVNVGEDGKFTIGNNLFDDDSKISSLKASDITPEYHAWLGRPDLRVKPVREIIGVMQPSDSEGGGEGDETEESSQSEVEEGEIVQFDDSYQQEEVEPAQKAQKLPTKKVLMKNFKSGYSTGMGDGDPRGPYGDPREPSGTLPKRKMGTSSSQMTPQTSDSDKNQGSCIKNSVGEKVAHMEISATEGGKVREVDGDPQNPSETPPESKVEGSTSETSPNFQYSDKNNLSCVENCVEEKVAYMATGGGSLGDPSGDPQKPSETLSELKIEGLGSKMSEKLLDTAPGKDTVAEKPVKSVKKRMKKYFYMVDFSPETEKFYSENKVLSTRRLRLKNGMEKISSMKVEMIKKHLQYLFTIHYVLRTANGQFLFLNDGKFLHLPLMCQMHYQGFSARKIIVSAYPVDPKNFEKAILLLGRECGCAEHSTEPGFLKQGAMTSVCKMSESCIKEMLRRCEEKLKPFARRYEPLNGVWLAAYIEDPAWDGEVINAIANSPRSILCEGTDMIYCEDGKYPPSQASAQTQAQAQAQTEVRAQAESKATADSRNRSAS